MPIFKMRCFTQSRQFTDWFLVGIVVSSLILLTCSQTKADPASKECGERQHKCICGIPRCIEPELVKNGVQDCQDGSDEGQWDPSKCAIKNNTSENIRFRRAALSERTWGGGIAVKMKHPPPDIEEFGTDIAEQRVIGGRLHIQSGRNLATKVMSNGVEVIVKGDKTNFIGYDEVLENTPIAPNPVSPRPITFPPSTVSRQFHLVEHPGKPNAINHLLHSIVRSATPDMITKTLVTTFTYMTTVLENTDTVVNSREQIISNVVTEKFRPTIEYTPNLKAEPSSIPPYLMEALDSSYLINTLTTTYTYFNTFTAGTIPIVVTSKETVSNVITMPAYLATPTLVDLAFHSRVYETETYYTTFTFSKTLAEENSRVVTTMETVTQVVVTEALIPVSSPAPTLTPTLKTPQGDMTKTYLTTFTYLTTAIERGTVVVQSSTVVSSQIVTEKLGSPLTMKPTLVTGLIGSELRTPSITLDSMSSQLMESVPLPSPTLMQPTSIMHMFPEQTLPKDSHLLLTATTRILEPVMIFATKTYYTTYTYFTTVLGEGSSTKINSRTQVASKIVTEALSTAFDIEYVNALKSSYLAKHSTLLEITSTIKEIIPDATLREPTLVTQSISHPHYPKDEDFPGIMDPITPSTSSSEHFDELKEGINHIVHVLADTQSDEYEIITPSQVSDPLYSTLVAPTTVYNLFDEIDRTTKDPDVNDDVFTEGTTEGNNAATDPVQLKINNNVYSSSISHRPTPPLNLQSVKAKPSSDLNDQMTTLKNPFDDPTLLPVPILVTGPPKSVIYDTDDPDREHDHDHGHGSAQATTEELSPNFEFNENLNSEEPVYGDMNVGDISSLVDIYVNSMYNNKNKPTSQLEVKTEDGLILSPSIINKFDMSGSVIKPSKIHLLHPSQDLVLRIPSISKDELTPTAPSPTKSLNTFSVDPTQQIFDMLSEITAEGEPPDYYDEMKETEAFKEQYDEVSKVYNISTILSTKTRQPSAQSTKISKNPSTTMKTTTKTTTKKTTAAATQAPTKTTEKFTTKKVTRLPSTPTSSTSKKTTQVTWSPHTTFEEYTTTDGNSKLPMEDTTTYKPMEIFVTPRITTVKPARTKKPTKSGTIVKEEVFDEQKDNKDFDDDQVTVITLTHPGEGDADDTEVIIKLTSKKPELPQRVTTTWKPKRKSKPKVTLKTTTPRPIKTNDEISPSVYALGPIREPGIFQSSTSEEESGDEEHEADTDNDNDNDQENKSEQDESDEALDFPDRPPPGPIGIPPTVGHTGPSKSSVGGPMGGPGIVLSGGNTGSQIVSASSSGINWTPLLNLGALGLGGLGASTLTKLGPMFSSVAGYMKHALPLAGIARNDTHHNKNNNERPAYNRGPQDDGMGQHYHSGMGPGPSQGPQQQYNPMGPNFVKVNSNGPPPSSPFSDSIPRRPILSHANEPNFRPLANRDPDGPFHRFENGPWPNNHFPPTNNYNFQPPNDEQPNIFSELNIHKHGDPPGSGSSEHIMSIPGPNIFGNPGNSPQNNRHQQQQLMSQPTPQQMLPTPNLAMISPSVRPSPSSGNSGERRPFPRPPPRSQEGSPNLPPWGEHTLMPLPPTPTQKQEKPDIHNLIFGNERPSYGQGSNSNNQQNNPFQSRPVLIDSDEMSSGEIFLNQRRPPQNHNNNNQNQHFSNEILPQQPRPSPTVFFPRPGPEQRPNSGNFNPFTEPSPIRRTPEPINTVQIIRPTEITITRNDQVRHSPPPTRSQPQVLHHMDKVYYNNVELISGNENPLLTISIEKSEGNNNNRPNHPVEFPRPTIDTPTTSTTKITISAPDSPKPTMNILRRPPPPISLPFENSAESIEHDLFVPPPRFPPTNSMSFLPTPPPMTRPAPAPQNGNTFNQKENQNEQRPFNFGQSQRVHPMNQFVRQRPPFNPDNSGESSQQQPKPSPFPSPPVRNQNTESRPSNPQAGNENRGPPRPNPNPPFRPPIPPNRNSDENLSRHPDQHQSFEINRPINMPRPSQLRPLFPNQRLRNPNNNNNNNNGQQPIFNRPQSDNSNTQQNLNRFKPMGSTPAILNPFIRPTQSQNSQEIRRPFNNGNNNGRPVPDFPPRNSEEFHASNGPNRDQIYIPPINQQYQGSRERPNFQRPTQQRPLPPPPRESDEFGNFAQPHQKQPVLLPGLQKIQWPNQNSSPKPTGSAEQSQQSGSSEREKQSSSLENHRLPPNFVNPSPTQQVPPHEQRPSTIFLVRETYDAPTRTRVKTTTSPPPTSPATQFPKLIIKEISTTSRSPTGGIQSVSTTPRPTTPFKFPSRATISKLNFIRRFTTPKPASTTTTPNAETRTTRRTLINSFIISPSVSDLMKPNASGSSSKEDEGVKNINRFSGKLPNPFSKGPVLAKFPFRSTTRKPFDASKYFTNVANSDPNFGQDFSGSEDRESIIDPVNQKVIKSPFDPVEPTSFIRLPQNGRNTTITGTGTGSFVPSTLSPSPSTPDSSEEESEEQKIINKFTVPNGFLPSTPKEFNDLWWPTTFKPQPTISTDGTSTTHQRPRIPPSAMPPTKESIHAPTTFRNTVKPTTFRPGLIRNPFANQNNGDNGENQRQHIRNQLRRPNDRPVGIVDENEGIQNVHIKNIELLKVPHLPNRPGSGSPFNPNSNGPPPRIISTRPRPENSFEDAHSGERPGHPNPNEQSQYSEEEYSEEVVKDTVVKGENDDKERRPLKSSKESIVLVQPNKPQPSKRPEIISNKDREEEDDESNETHDNDNGKLPFPAAEMQPPSPPPNYNSNNNNGDPPLRGQFHVPPPYRPQPPNRPIPSPIEAITNIFRRPGPGGRPRPDFMPQSHPVPGPPPQNNGNGQRRPDFIRRPFPPPHPHPQSPQGSSLPSPGFGVNPNPNPLNRNPNPNQILRRPQPPIRGNENDDRSPEINVIKTNIIRPPRPPHIPLRPVTTTTATKTTTETINKNKNQNQKEVGPTKSTPQSQNSEEISDELENQSNEIILDDVRSTSTTPKDGPIRVQNQQKSTTPEGVKPQENTKTTASTLAKPSPTDQSAAAAAGSQQEEDSDEYYDEYEDEKEEPPKPPPLPPIPSPKRPVNSGGYLANNHFRRPVRPGQGPGGGQRPPQRQPPSSGGQKEEQATNLRPFIIDRRPILPPNTEMRPPAPQQNNRQRPPILDFPSRGPVRYRPQQPVRPNNLRPNLLRPDQNLFKTTQNLLVPQHTLHTIASVDDDNKIVGTNVFTAILPSREILRSRFEFENNIRSSETLEGAENIIISPTPILEGSESSVSPTSVLRYSSGSLQTLASYVATISPSPSPTPLDVDGPEDSDELTESEEEEYEDYEEDTIIPSRLKPSKSFSRSVVRTIIKTTVVRTRGGASSITPTATISSSSASKTIEELPSFSSSPSSSASPSPSRAPTPTTENSSHLNSTSTTTTTTVTKTTTSTTATTPTPTTTKSTNLNRFVLPARRPVTKPPVVNVQTSPTTSSTDREAENEINEKENKTVTSTTSSTTLSVSRKPFTPSRNQTYTGFPPWNRRSTTTTSTTPNPVGEQSSSGEDSTERPLAPSANQKTQNATRRFNNTNRRPFLTTSTTTVPTTTTPPPPSMETTDGSKEKINNGRTPPFTFRPFRRPGSGFGLNASTTPTLKQATPSTPISTESTDEDSDEEKDDKDTAENRPVIVVGNSPLRPQSNGDHRKKEGDEDDHENEDSHTYRPQGPTNNNTRLQSSVDVQINPTRVLQRGKPRITGLGPSRTNILLSSSKPTTRFVTHTETKTHTITETETTVMSSSGKPVTHTVMITKTLPPQTLVSTIVGTVTVVNTVEVQPTTVRTTIFAEPTIIIPSFTDTTEQTTAKDDNVQGQVLQGGILTAGGRHKPRLPSSTPTASLTTETSVIDKRNRVGPPEIECINNCGFRSNEVCRRYANGTRSRCVCKPGYARMKSTIACKPTFTYELTMALSHMEGMNFDFKELTDEASSDYQNFITVTKDAVDKAFMSTDVKSKYQGSEVTRLTPRHIKDDRKNMTRDNVGVNFLVHLALNVSDDLVKSQFVRQLKSSDFNIGRSGITSTKTISDFAARDFDECTNPEYNDCSENADCSNVKGSFTCECRSGFLDKSKMNSPGRDCQAMDGCVDCNYHGKCIVDAFGNPGCNCFRWYGGAVCQINLKVLLISIIAIGLILFVMVLLCGIIVCRRKKPIPRERTGSGRFLRYRSPTSQATMERTAIMHDSGSSDGSQTPPTRIVNPQSFTPDSLLVETADKGFSRISRENVNLMNFSLRNVVMDQQDRSLTVVIPRAKIRPSSRPPSRPNPPSSALGGDAAADIAASEKLMNYLDQGAFTSMQSNRPGGAPVASSSRQSTALKTDAKDKFRKLSLQEQRKITTGALVSSGTEVSAQGGMRRRSAGLPLLDGGSNFMGSVSEVRSFDETIRSPAKPAFSDQTSRASCYSCKPPSYCAYSESHGHTMNEKDGASTVYTTQGKLFRMSHDQDTDDGSSMSD